jgi:shikimate dehydrogenase
MQLFGLIGYPLGHSFSASYFEKKFREEGIEASYRNFPLEHIEDFASLLKREPGLSGLNVTVPFKQAIIPFLDRLSEVAEEIRAVNTISFRRAAESMVLAGDNTDVIGFRRSLEEHLKPGHTSALVLGTGGSSRAIQYVLGQLGIGFIMVSRSAGTKSVEHQDERGDENRDQMGHDSRNGVDSRIRRITYRELDSKLVGETPLIINTTPLGMFPEVEACPDIPYDALTPDHLLFDLVYNPARTVFLKRGEEMGAMVVNGYDMLVYQAEASWGIWNSTS